MNLKQYFDTTGGLGIMSTADAAGKVDAAVYSRPHVMDDGTLAFIMLDRLTHTNLQSNPHAHYLFKEDAPGYKGFRFFLTKIREEQDSDLLRKLRRGKSIDETSGPRFLVFFRIDETLPLVTPRSQPLSKQA